MIKCLKNKTAGVITAAMVSSLAFFAASSEDGLKYTQEFEGTVLANYIDSVGVETWCTGETQLGRLSGNYTEEYCNQLFYASYSQYSSNLYSCYDDEMKKYVTPAMHAAFTDVYYNTGSKCNTGMMRALKNGDPLGACNYTLKYKFVGGKDCSIRSNNCYGVWDRRMAMLPNCLTEAKNIQTGGAE